MRPLGPLPLGLLAVALTTCACTAGAGAELDGRTFLSTKVEGRTLVAGTIIRLGFAAGHVSVSAGCNQMGGTYRVEGDRLTVSVTTSTEMACDPPLMAQDEWAAKYLAAGVTFRLEDQALTLAWGDVTITMGDRRVVDPDRPLVGTRWVLDTIITGDAAASVPAGVTAGVRFSDGRVAVETGCNTGGGPATVEESAITFGSIGLTKKACGAPFTTVELAMNRVLTGRVAFAIEGQVLMLTGDGAGLGLRAAP